jgi:23S rRNA pseudouridine2604 synthase
MQKTQIAPLYPMRINKYLASKKYCTRRDADELIQKHKVLINGRVAQLGDKVQETDEVKVTFRPRAYRYFAYNKPRGVISHSPQDEEQDIASLIPEKGVYPIGRLDKDSSGLIILTDDGRITEALLSPENDHEKEYEVVTLHSLPHDFKEKMERGVDIGGYTTKPCTVRILGDKKFSIVITEGKKHQIRRMCGAFGQSAVELKRKRILNIRLGTIKSGAYQRIEGEELGKFRKALGFTA